MGTVDVTKLTENLEQEPEATADVPHDPWRKWMWWALGLLLVGQIYFFQELFAALVIFTVLFVILAMMAGSIYLVGRAGRAGISAAEPAARRGMAVAEDLSRKTFHRPHSTIVP